MSEAAVKKYVVRLSAEERQTLAALISKGKHPAALVLKARILLKADVSEAGEGWSDSRTSLRHRMTCLTHPDSTAHRHLRMLIGPARIVEQI